MVKEESETYVQALEAYLYNDNIPQSKRSEILRAKPKEKLIDRRKNTYMNGNNEENPTTVGENIVNNDFDDMINANVRPHSQDGEYEDMTDTMFNELRTRIEIGYDWSIHYDVKYVDALTKYATVFYKRQQQQRIDGDNDGVQLFNYDK